MVRPCVFDCMHACVSGFDCACVREWALVFLFCTQKCSPCHVTTFFFFFLWLAWFQEVFQADLALDAATFFYDASTRTLVLHPGSMELGHSCFVRFL